MALGILGAMGLVGATEQHLFIGELSLDGSIRPVRGALSVAACARRQGIRNLLVPMENAAEASVAEGVNVYGMRHLSEVVKFLANPNAFLPVDAKAAFHAGISGHVHDFAEVRGQTVAKRALEVAAAGSHNVLMDRAARLRKNHAGPATPRHPAAAHVQ